MGAYRQENKMNELGARARELFFPLHALRLAFIGQTLIRI